MQKSAATAQGSGTAALPKRRSGGREGALLLAMPALLLVAIFFAFPLLRLIASSFEGAGLPFYAKALGSGGLYLNILGRTFEIAAIVTACCLVLGYPLAFFLATTTKGWRTLGFAFIMLPLWTSVLVRTYAWMVLLGRNGIVNRVLIDSGLMSEPLRLLNTQLAVVLGMVHVMLPFMVLPIYSALMRVDPDLPRAAIGLGASRARAFTTIYLPLTLRGVVAGVTLVFVVSLGFYITPALLGGGKVTMFAMIIEQQVREFLAWNFAGALAMLLLAATLAIFAVLNWGVERRLGERDA
ncbi:MAG: ABC transporter permease [Proteobacteria bacterium]|nr:ABC transporter permease [Pseudomonadota bacterium]